MLDVFKNMENKAIRIYREDKKVDREYVVEIVCELMDYMMINSKSIPNMLSALFFAHGIEGTGSCYQNICEIFFYFVKSQRFSVFQFLKT